MKVAEILGVDEVVFVEPQFSVLPDPRYNDTLTLAGGDEGRLLLDEKEDPLALAFRNGDCWITGSFLSRNPTALLIEKFENLNGEIYQEDRAVWAAAVREYYSLALKAEVPPAIEDLNPRRRGILTNLISGFWDAGSGETCIDACCGSGVGSLVLRDLGFTPLSYDNDDALLSLGLSTGRLLPEETMWIDAMKTSAYIEPVPKGIGIMMGEINSFSQDMWQQIISQLFAVSRETLITVGTEPEALLIKSWGEELGRQVEVTENPADPIYDLWVCRSLGK
ncbi:hypothetical protein [Methanoregula sp.]|uniref:hypothetical protein n=1 Tax=Methanoregula sp. TaxID=2052170 RepID=UPI00236CEBEB|nr:hypothetical protein [Methanoregula sp.]MDD1687706.1 hypothetical protein [Methanoregula sp.]